jgi:hypothetical protein
MTFADQIPVALGIAGGLGLGAWAAVDRLRALAHDRALQRLQTEEDDHDATRRALADSKRRINELESKLGAKSSGA